MKGSARNFPVEFYILIAVSYLLFLTSLSFSKSLAVNGFNIREFLAYSFGRVSPFSPVLLVLLLILSVGVFSIIAAAVLEAKLPPSARNQLEGRRTASRRYVLNISLIILVLSFATYSFLLFSDLISQAANPAATAHFSNLFSSWDKTIFGTEPGPWLIRQFSHTMVGVALPWVYDHVGVALSLVILFSLFFNRLAFRKLILSFFIAWFMALPLWFLFPAISPDFMFRLNVLNVANSQEVAAFNHLNADAPLQAELAFQEAAYPVKINPPNRTLPVTTFPSMHAAWGTIIAYAGMVLYPPLGIILVPLSLLNDVSCVYTLEHYGVDVLSGVVIALISIAITEMILRLGTADSREAAGLFSEINLSYPFDQIRSILNRFRKNKRGRTARDDA